jgi:hypothetical protein
VSKRWVIFNVRARKKGMGQIKRKESFGVIGLESGLEIRIKR